MDTQEILNILLNAKPTFEKMESIYNESELIEMQLNQKRTERQSGLSAGHWVITFFLCCIYIVPGIIYYNVVKKSRNERLDKEISSLMAQLNHYKAEIEKLVKIILQTGIQRILPQQYLNIEAVSQIILYLQSNRVDSLKEALNLFDENQHRLNMERMQMQALEQAQFNGQMIHYNNIINTANALNNLSK